MCLWLRMYIHVVVPVVTVSSWINLTRPHPITYSRCIIEPNKAISVSSTVHTHTHAHTHTHTHTHTHIHTYNCVFFSYPVLFTGLTKSGVHVVEQFRAWEYMWCVGDGIHQCSRLLISAASYPSVQPATHQCTSLPISAAHYPSRWSYSYLCEYLCDQYHIILSIVH